MERAIPLLLVLASGCTYDEGITIENFRGKIVVPLEAATRTWVDATGQAVETVDTRNIGPVYLGFYPTVKSGLLEYPHPEIGPVFKTGVPGDTYPYGGTTVGDFRFACIEFLACRTVSGRFVDFDNMLDWYDNVLNLPIPDASGAPITSGDYIRQVCYEMLNYTSDEEIRITATDRNGDDVIDQKDLDFVQNDDGDFEAEFIVWQQEYYQNDDGQGFTLWGWMDAPSDEGFRFSTCDPQNGYNQNEYATQFFGGRPYLELLNHPSQYISTGDWVSGEPNDGPGSGYHVYHDPDDDVVIRLGYEVTQ